MVSSRLIQGLSLVLMAGENEPVAVRRNARAHLQALLDSLPARDRVDAAEDIAVFAQWLGDEKESPDARRALLTMLTEVVPELPTDSRPFRRTRHN